MTRVLSSAGKDGIRAGIESRVRAIMARIAILKGNIADMQFNLRELQKELKSCEQQFALSLRSPSQPADL